MDKMFFFATVYGPYGKKVSTKEWDFYQKLLSTGWFDEEEEAVNFYAPKPEPKKKPKPKAKRTKKQKVT